MTATVTADGTADGGWMAEAACRDRDARLFTEPDGPDDVRQALATCATCTVREPCLTTALRHPASADVGIWGGTTEQARRRIRSGRLSIEEALTPQLPEPTEPPARTEPRERPASGAGRDQPQPSKPSRSVARLATPEITVARNADGDYVSADGRVVIFRIHGEPPWMLMIDQRCIARTRTLTEARRTAWREIHATHQRPGPSADTRSSHARTR